MPSSPAGNMKDCPSNVTSHVSGVAGRTEISSGAGPLRFSAANAAVAPMQQVAALSEISTALFIIHLHDTAVVWLTLVVGNVRFRPLADIQLHCHPPILWRA